MPKRLRKAFVVKNTRRCDLIYKDIFGGGLSEEEEEELRVLDDWVAREIDRVYPADWAVLGRNE